MTSPKLTFYQVVRESPRVWVMNYGWGDPAEAKDEEPAVTLLRSERGEAKTRFVARCAAHCRFNATKARPISLRIHAIDGRFLEERTYPKSADPRRSKG